MKIYIGTDHRGNEIKEELVKELNHLGYNDIYVSKLPNSDTDDYADFAFDICTKMNKQEDVGVLICGNGIGMSIAANKVKGIRCARVLNKDDANKAKIHNDANVLALGADYGLTSLVEIIDEFIKTEPCHEERHLRRVQKIIDYENGAYNEL